MNNAVSHYSTPELEILLTQKTKLWNDNWASLTFDAWFCALVVISNYTCSLYHIVLHCLLTDNTATSYCKPNCTCKRVFVQLSLKETGALPIRSDSITFRHSAGYLNESLHLKRNFQGEFVSCLTHSLLPTHIYIAPLIELDFNCK